MKPEIFLLAARLLLEGTDKTGTSCWAIGDAVHALHGKHADVKRMRKLMTKWFAPRGSGLYYFETPECDYYTEKEHRILSLILMYEILKEGAQ